MTLPKAVRNEARSVVAAAAAVASASNLTKAALNPAASSQIFGAAVVSPPVFEVAGNSAGIFLAESM